MMVMCKLGARPLIVELILLVLLFSPGSIKCESFVGTKDYKDEFVGRGGEGSTYKSNKVSRRNNGVGPKITWMPTKRLYLCDNYHFSVTTPNSYIYPKLEIRILESTLTQGFTVFLRCGNMATPYNFDTRVDIPSGIDKGSVFDSKLPLCNFPLLDNNAYNIDIYIGDVDIEFTRRHYCPCSSQYVVISIECLVEYNSNEIVTLSPSSEYSLSGPINGGEIGAEAEEAGHGMKISNDSLPLNNLKIFSIPVCVLENDFVTICNAILQFSIQIGEDKSVGGESSHNFCVYLSPYNLNEGLLETIGGRRDSSSAEKDGRSLLSGSSATIGHDHNIGKDSLALIPAIKDHLTSSLSPNICIDLREKALSDQRVIRNEDLPPQLRSNIGSITVRMVNNGGNDVDGVKSLVDDQKSDPKMIRVSFVLNNIRPSKYFIYPFMFQSNTRSNVGLGMSGGGSAKVLSVGNDFNMRLFYDLNYTQLTGDPFIVKWLPTRIRSSYKLDNIPKVIESDNLDFNVKLGESFYVVIPKIATNILSFESNNLIIYITSELLYLFEKYDCSLIIDYVGLLGRFPIHNDGNSYNLIKDYELKETRIFNIASNPKVVENSLIQIANISIPLTMNNNLPYTFKMTIRADMIKPAETKMPIGSINIRMKHKMVPTMCKESTCSGHGDCSLVEYSRNINIYCSCYPGWGGFYCSYPYLSSQSILAYPITLVGTNFVAIPTICVCVFKKKWLVAFLAFVAGLVSSIFHAAEVGLLVDHEDILLKGDLISAQLIISFVFILLCRFNYKIEISLLCSQIIILVLLTLLTSRLVTTVIPLVNCFAIFCSRIIYWYFTTKLYSEKIPSEVSCAIPIELSTNTLNTPTHLISRKGDEGGGGVGLSGFEKVVDFSNSSPSVISISAANASNVSASASANRDNTSVVSQFNISRVGGSISVSSVVGVVQGLSSVWSFSSLIRNVSNFTHRLQYSIVNSYKKLVFIFDREYYSPRHILIGFIMGAVGCITWFLETVDTYWFFHSIWHIMAFLASTFIVHGCLPPKIHIMQGDGRGVVSEMQYNKQKSFQLGGASTNIVGMITSASSSSSSSSNGNGNNT